MSLNDYHHSLRWEALLPKPNAKKARIGKHSLDIWVSTWLMGYVNQNAANMTRLG